MAGLLGQGSRSSGSCPHVKMVDLDLAMHRCGKGTRKVQESESGASPINQRLLSGLRCMDAGDVG